MKLLTVATQTSLRASALIFLVGGLVFFGIIRVLINEEVDEELDVDRLHIQAWVRQHGRLPGTDSQALFNYITFQVGEPANPNGLRRDSSLIDIRSGKQQPYRLITFPVRAQGQVTQITLGKPLLETDELLVAIVLASVGLGGVVLLTVSGINRRLSRRLLQPFYQALVQLEGYQLRRNQPLELAETGDIDEFRQLNESVNQLTRRVLVDYRNVREFTANASHELQTPVAIAQSQIEVLLQNDRLPVEVTQGLSAIQRTVSRLARLNQTLLLLAKIENGQFEPGLDRVALLPLIEDKLTDLADWIEHRRIVVAKDLHPADLQIHPVLADILVANLLGNAVRHNVDAGKLDIFLTADELRIRNTGRPLTVPPETLFARFQKAGDAPQSMGLGLSIVREIGNQNGLTIAYTYGYLWHELTVNWP